MANSIFYLFILLFTITYLTRATDDLLLHDTCYFDTVLKFFNAHNTSNCTSNGPLKVSNKLFSTDLQLSKPLLHELKLCNDSVRVDFKVLHSVFADSEIVTMLMKFNSQCLGLNSSCFWCDDNFAFTLEDGNDKADLLLGYQMVADLQYLPLNSSKNCDSVCGSEAYLCSFTTDLASHGFHHHFVCRYYRAFLLRFCDAHENIDGIYETCRRHFDPLFTLPLPVTTVSTLPSTSVQVSTMKKAEASGNDTFNIKNIENPMYIPWAVALLAVILGLVFVLSVFIILYTCLKDGKARTSFDFSLPQTMEMNNEAFINEQD